MSRSRKRDASSSSSSTSKKMTKTSSSSFSSSITTNKYFNRPPTIVLTEYLYFLQYRMHIWAHMYPKRAALELVHANGTPFTITQKDPMPFIPPEHLCVENLLKFSTFGNAYRHLDSGTHLVGQAVRLVVGGNVDSDPNEWSNEQIARALLMCVLNGAGFIEATVQECFPEWKDIPVEKFPMRARLPSTVEEVKKFGGWLRKQHTAEQNEKGAAFSPLFSGRSQDVGRNKWANYLTRNSVNKHRWTDFNYLTTVVVPTIQNANTWIDGLNALMTMNGAGQYVGGQAFCDIFFGVWGSKPGLFKYHDRVCASMEDETGAGPGPRRSLEDIFNLSKKFMNKDEELILGLKGLTERIPHEFQKLDIDFPYLSKEDNDDDDDGSKIVAVRLLSCVDLEHSMCYFHRYLKAKRSLGEIGMKALNERFTSEKFQHVKRQPIKKFSKLKHSGVEGFCNKLLEKARKGEREQHY